MLMVYMPNRKLKEVEAVWKMLEENNGVGLQFAEPRQ